MPGARAAADVAAEVIREVGQSGRPADRVLRDFLKREGIHGRAGGEAAALVFAWYRWCGMLERFRPDARGLARAAELDERFRRDPARIESGALARGAVPAWVHEEVAVSETWIRALQTPPALWLRVRPGAATELATALPELLPPRFPSLPEAVVYPGRTDLFRTEAFERGLFEIQDVASQAVGHACAARPGETWWDACAGEGGKMLHLAAMMENRGLVWASDRSERRLEVLRRRAARAGVFNYRSVLWSDDARAPTRTRFDGVLVDAPCSGIGTWGRNPHARWTTALGDVRELASVQERLLALAATSVKPGGRLVYAVCTLARSETDAVADRFESSVEGFVPEPWPSPFAGAEAVPTARHAWWPQETGGNGMFVARWRRESR
ncbi:RsmB/NOP family class I SAM-dependent RNA methyltransferase [Opitutales bacterium ASA1]|nr:RsmB/NOP family class I SAM-dependent RNA methyltransferase [Opitutales bacterium ASA1]